MTLASTINGDAIRETFREWNAERDSLDAELNESLAALEAYQLHLDAWHRQLAGDREQLQTARQQLEHDRELAEKSQSDATAAMLAELHESREKVTALTALLLNRTEELRTLDNRRSEAQTELELARARERELTTALDEYKRSVEQERSQWTDERKHLRELIERQLDAPVVEVTNAPAELQPSPASSNAPVSAAPIKKAPSNGGAPASPSDNPLLGSIVEQFGKLRQQRAVERQAQNKQR